MRVHYDKATDVLYLRFDPRTQQLDSVEAPGEIILDFGDNEALVGIETLDASRRVDFSSFLSLEVELPEMAPSA